MLPEVQQKVSELGYTVQKMDTVNFELVADRPLDPPVDGATREEMIIRIAPDNTGSTKLTVTASRVIPATADRPLKRVTASARTNCSGVRGIGREVYTSVLRKGRPLLLSFELISWNGCTTCIAPKVFKS